MVSVDIVALHQGANKGDLGSTRTAFEEGVLGFFRHVLTTSYFTFNGQFYGKTDGVAIGSPLFPVMANFYMEDYEKAALESPLPLIKPRCSFRYVEDTFIIWPHGPDKLRLSAPPKQHP
jgi:hypothetical protein